MTQSGRPSAVVKVGGSLLDWPEIVERLTEFLASSLPPPERTVLVVGGGRTVDVIRDLDATHRLGDLAAHRLAIRALDLTAHLLAEILPGSMVVRDESELRACWDNGVHPILSPTQLIEKHETDFAADLPASWDVTSDSIAAWIARILHADRLMLLKSTEAPAGCGRSVAAELGLVDPHFPSVALPIDRVEYRNLRDPSGYLCHLSR